MEMNIEDAIDVIKTFDLASGLEQIDNNEFEDVKEAHESLFKSYNEFIAEHNIMRNFICKHNLWEEFLNDDDFIRYLRDIREEK